MLNFDSLIGLELSKAKNILNNFGIKNIDVVMNSRNCQVDDTAIVCVVKKNADGVVLICGEFNFNLKELDDVFLQKEEKNS